MDWKRSLLLLAVASMVAGCSTVPMGPSVAVLPGPEKPFDVFQADDMVCRQWASQQIGGVSPGQKANQNVAGGAALGTLAGAGLGAAVGAATGNVGAGAAIGGATGFAGGTAAGSSAASGSRYELQQRYDIAYQQCMYSKGNQIPGVAAVQRNPYPPRTAPPSQGQPTS
jgi:uncharacterized protein YcfJ